MRANDSPFDVADHAVFARQLVVVREMVDDLVGAHVSITII